MRIKEKDFWGMLMCLFLAGLVVILLRTYNEYIWEQRFSLMELGISIAVVVGLTWVVGSVTILGSWIAACRKARRRFELAEIKEGFRLTLALRKRCPR